MVVQLLPFMRNFATRKLTVDERELKHFAKLATVWWDPNGTLKGLQSFNKCRVPWIRNRLTEVGAIRNVNKNLPLQGLSFLDVGCGGGILTEALSRLGCRITGLDANDVLINIARAHASSDLPNLKYECGTIQEHAEFNKEKYDVVVSSETIEHVTEKEDFVKYCLQCLKPGGSIFMTTPNKTWLSRLCVIFILEDVLFHLPKGTHTYDMFIHLENLKKLFENENCETVYTSGLIYNPFTDRWFLIKNEKISYAIHAIKRN